MTESIIFVSLMGDEGGPRGGPPDFLRAEGYRYEGELRKVDEVRPVLSNLMELGFSAIHKAQ